MAICTKDNRRQSLRTKAIGEMLTKKQCNKIRTFYPQILGK